MSEKSTRNDVDYAAKSQNGTAIAPICVRRCSFGLQNRSRAVNFSRFRAEKGDSCLGIPQASSAPQFAGSLASSTSTRSRPFCFARYSATSAWRSRSRISWPERHWDTPTLAVSSTCMGAFTIGSSRIRCRNRSAITRAASALQLGSTTRNSSPPYLPTWSYSRTAHSENFSQERRAHSALLISR